MDIHDTSRGLVRRGGDIVTSLSPWYVAVLRVCGDMVFIRFLHQLDPNMSSREAPPHDPAGTRRWREECPIISRRP